MPDEGLPSAAGGISRLAYAKAKAAGVALEPLLKQAHLTSLQLENPSARLKVRDQIQFLNLVSEALPDDLLGYRLAQVPDPREFGMLYYLMASAETLLDAVNRAGRYTSIVNEGIASKCAATGDEMTLSLRYVGVNRHPDRHQMEFWMTATMRVFRRLTGLNLLPRSVRLIHVRKGKLSELSEYLGNDIQFGAAVDEMVFPVKTAKLPVVSADAYLNKLLVQYCEEALARRIRSGGSFRSSVENTVVPLLPHGRANVAEISRRLGIGQRTFARRLSSEGLTFSSLVEVLRFDLAKRYLQDKNLSISQIAWLLGYQEVAGFSHAFKRWSGKTPRSTRSSGRHFDSDLSGQPDTAQP